jgi:hypothetical protein
MKRHVSPPTAAAPTAAVPKKCACASSQTALAPGQAGSSPAPEGFEIDLSDPSEYNHRKNRSIDLFVRLEELHPADPGQLGGAVLYLGAGGPHTFIHATLACESRHILGYFNAASIRRLVEEAKTGASIAIGLREYYAESRQDRFSGATLAISGGESPEAQLCFGAHCFGVLRGDLLAKFLECVAICGPG